MLAPASGRLAPVVLSLFAATTLLAQGPRQLFNIRGAAAHDLCGISVAGVGDLDGDGVPDLAAGAYTAQLERGRMAVYSGRDARELIALVGESAGDRLGRSVAGAGDVDGDGVGDVAVGAYLADAAAGVDAGRVYLVSGRTGAVLRRIDGRVANGRFGFAVCGVGDLDGDGRAEVMVGAPQAAGAGPEAGAAYVFSGRDGSVLRAFAGGAAFDWFGYAVAGPGDVDGDGTPDLLIGAVYDDAQAPNSGSALLYSGRTGALLHRFTGKAQGDWFGTAVAGVGDVDGDGRPDLLVGAQTADTAGKDAGAAYLFSGRTFQQLRAFAGERAGDQFGGAVAGAGDVDGDRAPDLLIGAYRSSAGAPGAGSVYVFSGRTGRRLDRFDGDATDDRLGVAVAPVGDLDGDGAADFAAGAVYDDTAGTEAGSVRVFSGAPLTCWTDVHTASIAGAGAQQLTLEAGTAQAGRSYWMLGSLSGTAPGTAAGAFVLPLNYDSYMQGLIDGAGPPVWVGFRGTLDAAGGAAATLTLPAGLAPSLAGTVLHHAFFTFDDRGRIRMVSNAVPLRLVD